ncbi:MAG: DUF4384 domain-containing protein [Nostoc sp.]|uniref:DUF4384 domain-containing protein n=1 Tax=Nostoc sp. TaxID=1180 RepID=UPI002FFB86BC
MSVVSLIASPSGTQRARQALRRLNLTQRALVNERGIASWSTVNNFFNGKPVKREIFMEICEELNLNWQDIVISFSEDKENTLQLTPFNKLWQELISLASLTEEMGMVLVKEETLGWRKKISNPYEKLVRLGSYIQFEINLPTPGYLLLIQRDALGEVWCFCPSFFAPQPELSEGKTSLPQQGSPMTSFFIEGTPGKEQILAVVTPDAPNFAWLMPGNDEVLKITENFLLELLNYVKINGSSQILYIEYQIIE